MDPEEQPAPDVAEEEAGAQEAASGEGDQGNGVAAGPPAEEEPWRKRLWFVRMPRPPEAGGIKPLEQELETFRAQYNLITETLNVKKVERDSAREATRAAREAFVQCRAAYDERAAPLRKLQEQRQESNASATKLKQSFADLLVKSEAELDAQLAALHYTIEHESISLNDEKKALATIKRLEGQRERVREYEASAGLFAESRAKRGELQEALKESEGELSALRQEMDVQRQILDKLREHERSVDAEVEEVVGERRRCKELMDAAFHRMSGQRRVQREKHNAFYANRAFSRDVRKLLGEGKLEEARAACAAQADEAVGALAGDAALRAEYFALWEQQRKTPVVLPSAEDVDATLPPPSKGAKAGRRREAAPADPAKKAEATIAALLAEAREEARRAKAAAAAAAAHTHRAAAAEAAAEAAAQEEAEAAAARPPDAAAPEPEPPAEVVGAPPELSKPHKPPKPAAPRPAVEPVVVPPENFELPEAIRLKEKTPSSQELKELEREHNRQAQAEAERRKAKKAAEKQRKRQRQEALAAEAAAAAARASEAAASAQAAASAAAALAAEHGADAAAGSSSASEDGGAGAGEAAAAATPEPQPQQRKKGPSGGINKPHAPLPVLKAGAPKPAARRPAASKQAGLVKHAKRAARDYGVPAAFAAAALAVLVLLSLWWTAASVAPQ